MSNIRKEAEKVTTLRAQKPRWDIETLLPHPDFFFSQVKGGEDRVEEIIAAKLRDMGPRTPPPLPPLPAQGLAPAASRRPCL